jgi:hypothetical protein
MRETDESFSLNTGTDMTVETSVYWPFNHLMRLLSRESVIEFRGSEIFKLYARNFDVIVQYGTTASAAGNSKFYNTIVKLLKNSSVVVKSSNITEQKNISLLELRQFI